jgi:hypothetical protein
MIGSTSPRTEPAADRRTQHHSGHVEIDRSMLVRTAGETLRLTSEAAWVSRLAEECVGSGVAATEPEPTVDVKVGPRRRPFDIDGWRPLSRGAFTDGESLVLTDASDSGFQLRLRFRPSGQRLAFDFRHAPSLRTRLAGSVLRARAVLLARAALLHYPAMWSAGVRGRVPLHAPVCTAGDATPMLLGPGGSGKTTLIARELADGGSAISDNLSVSDGRAAWGVVEPLRVPSGRGRSMPHGRGEVTMADPPPMLEPDLLVLLRRGTAGRASTRDVLPSEAARALIAGTYMAGELRRYWTFAATLAHGSGLGPAHPAVERVAEGLAERLPCVEITLPATPGVRLADLVRDVERFVCA